MIDEVTVVAHRPVVKFTTDKVNYRVKDDPDSKTQTVLEMLRKVPRVTVDGKSNIEIGKNDAEVGYWIGKPHWNNGYCTEALQAMIHYCYEKKGFVTLWSDFFIDNPASGRVMEKCGFTDTGKENYCSNLYHGEDRPVHIMKLETNK